MPRKVKSASAKTAAAAAPAAEAAPAVQETAPVQNVVESTEPTIGDSFTELLTQLSAFRSQITALTAQVRTLRARSEREIRAAQKAGRKRRVTNRKPSGFVKPALISDELASFLGRPKGTEMARTEVTKEINQYIVTNNLQDKNNGRIIRADTKLRKLLRLNKSDELTYFNLQKYMSPHFPKKEATA
jgi:upstream activation factor subunit UAF30